MSTHFRIWPEKNTQFGRIKSVETKKKKIQNLYLRYRFQCDPTGGSAHAQMIIIITPSVRA